jgi:hypothetical protein
MAVKPNAIKAKQTYAYVGTTPTRRIQSLDWASNFTIDSVFELGNAGVVEDSITLVETSITMNSNEWGTTDLEAMVFNKYQQRNILGDGAVSGVANTTGSIYVSSFGAGGDWTGQTPAPAVAKYLQIHRFNTYATTNATEFVKILTIRTSKAGSMCDVIGLDPAYGLLDAAPATGDVVGLMNAYTIDQDTVDSDPTHLIMPHRHATTSTFIMHSVILPRAFVDNLTYRIDTGGAAEQNYTLVGEEERITLGGRREALSITGSFISYSDTATTGSLTFRIPKDSLQTTGSPYIVYAGSNLATAKKITHTSAAVTVVATLGPGLTVDSSTQIMYYATNKVKVGYKGITNVTSALGKVTKGNVVVNLTVGAGTEKKLQRVTGIDISIPLTRESVDELGETRSIAKPLEGNLRNEVTLTLTRNDLREYAQLLGNEAAFDAETLTEILMTDLKSVTDAQIVVKLYNSQTSHIADNLLKTMTFDDCSFIGDNTTTPVSGSGVVELKFSTQSVDIVGNNIPPTT